MTCMGGCGCLLITGCGYLLIIGCGCILITKYLAILNTDSIHWEFLLKDLLKTEPVE